MNAYRFESLDLLTESLDLLTESLDLLTESWCTWGEIPRGGEPPLGKIFSRMFLIFENKPLMYLTFAFDSVNLVLWNWKKPCAFFSRDIFRRWAEKAD